MAAKSLRDWTNTQRVLEEFGQRVVEAYKRQLHSRGKHASGKLANEVTYKVQKGGTMISVSLNLADYWVYVEKGRKAGGKFPPLDAIQKWIEVKPIIPRPDSNGRVPTIPQLTYLIGRKIAEQGIPPTNALSLSVKAVYQDMLVRLQEAIEQDIQDEVTVALM